MPVTLTIADELATELKPYEDKIAEILKLGMREWQARGESGYAGLSSVLERLAALPDPEEVLALRPAPQLQQRLEVLLEKTRTSGLSPSDQREWDANPENDFRQKRARGGCCCRYRHQPEKSEQSELKRLSGLLVHPGQHSEVCLHLPLAPRCR